MLSALLTVGTGPVWAQSQADKTRSKVILSQDDDFRVPLARHMDFFLDSTEKVTLDQVMDGAIPMRLIDRRYIDFGLTRSRIWLKTQLYNPSQKPGVWRLDLRRQFVRQLTVYVIRDNGAAQVALTHTNHDPFSARPIPDRYLAVDIPVDGEEGVDIVISYQSDASSWLPLTITTKEAYAVSHARENSFNWLINGALVAVLIIALILAPVVSWQISVAFCAYIISGSLFVFNSEGYAFQYLWPNAPGLNDPVDLVFALLMAASGLAFGRVIFDIERHSPILNRILVGVIAGSLICAGLTFVLFQHDLFKRLTYPIIFIAAALHLVLAGVGWRKGLPGAAPIVIGAICVLGSIAYAVVANSIPGRFSLERTLDVGHLTLLIEGIVFAIAISLRLYQVRLERDRALRAELSAAREKIALNEALSVSQTQYDKAAQLARQRRDELSSVRHDIGQPLTALRAAMTDLEGVDEATTDNMHAAFDYLEAIARRGNMSDRTIGRMPVVDSNEEVFPVTTVLDNIRTIFAAEAEGKGLQLRYRAISAKVQTDPLELMRMVSNLVSNAIKYTKEGGVLISVRRQGGKVEIGVWDTGRGMDPAALCRARKKYSKGENSTGSGLGLSLVNEAAERLGIELVMQSTAGHGTVVRLRLDEVPPHSSEDRMG
ncbi:MAG: sensor histidine kinase [Parvularcula sp.]